MSRTRHKLKVSRKRGAKRFASHCKNNGTCGWCLGNRTHKHKRKQAIQEEPNDVV